MRLSRILDLPKTLFFNFYYLPVKDAMRLPFRVDHGTRIKSMGKRGSVVLHDTHKKVVIGHGGSFALGGITYWEIGKNGKIDFLGSAVFGKGTQIIAGGYYTRR